MKCFLKRIVLLPLLSSSSSIISPSVLPLSRQNRRPVIFFFFKNGILTSHHVCQATLKRVRYDHQSTPIPPSTITSRCQPELGWAVWPCSPGDMWSCFTGTWRGGVWFFFFACFECLCLCIQSEYLSSYFCLAPPFPDLCVDTLSELTGHYRSLGKLQPLYHTGENMRVGENGQGSSSWQLNTVKTSLKRQNFHVAGLPFVQNINRHLKSA